MANHVEVKTPERSSGETAIRQNHPSAGGIPMKRGQGVNPPATKESGRTSARAQTAVKQTAKGRGGTAEQEIKALHAQLIEATLKHDTSFLEKHLADDYIAIRNDGKLTTKVQEIENYKSGVTKYESIEIREATIRIYGDTAVYNSLNSIKATINGKPFSADVRNTRVWVKQDGNWKIVVFQATQVVSGSQ
jgi:ketosteroid isomerase-like protein